MITKSKFFNTYVALGISIVSFLGLIGFFMSVSPDNVGFIVTLIPLLLVWVFIFSFVQALSAVFKGTKSPAVKIAALILPSIVVLTLMFSALGDISVLDGVLLLVLAVLGNFYLVRTWPK